MSANDEGYALTMFTVSFTLALFLVVGLIVDGGSVLSQRRLAMNDASLAARQGASAIDRSTGAIDVNAAREGIDDVLSGRDLVYDVNFECTDVCRAVTITVEAEADLRVLGLLGFRSKKVAATMSARVATGTDQEEPATS